MAKSSGKRERRAGTGTGSHRPAQDLRQPRGPEGHLADGARARRGGDPRLVGVGQVDLPALHQPARDAEQRQGPGQGRADRDDHAAGASRHRPDMKQVDRIRSKLAMVFQQFNLWQHMTVLDNVTAAQIHVLGRDKAEAVAKAEAMLAKVGVSRQARPLPEPALGRAAAAGGDRPRAGDGPRGDAVRRADLARSTRSWSTRC